MSSWLREEATRRSYRMVDNSVWIVQNAFQRVTCPSCKGELYCRMTHLWRSDPEGRAVGPEYHNNYNSDLRCLQELLVCYVADRAVREVASGNGWVLVLEGDVIGREVVK